LSVFTEDFKIIDSKKHDSYFATFENSIIFIGITMSSFKNDFPDELDSPEADYLYVKPSGIENAGNGLYTAIAIYKNEIIAVFKGEMLTEEESKLRADKHEDGYFVKMLDGNIMDSAHVECFAKYANDAEGLRTSGLKNNAKIALNVHDEVCLVATKKIKPGEEILTSYGTKYWLNHKRKQSSNPD
jgi:uncharacterized protein